MLAIVSVQAHVQTDIMLNPISGCKLHNASCCNLAVPFIMNMMFINNLPAHPQTGSSS